MEQALSHLAEPVEDLSRSLGQATDFLYLGRGVNYPIALEGALKMKEISYVHAEGYPAGEMKHGPIALIDERLPTVALCPQGRVYEKMLSNVQEVKARGGRVLAVVSAGDRQVRLGGSRRAGRGPRGARGPPRSSRRSSPCCPCSFSPTTWPCGRGATWTSRATSPSPSRSSSVGR